MVLGLSLSVIGLRRVAIFLRSLVMREIVEIGMSMVGKKTLKRGNTIKATFIIFGG